MAERARAPRTIAHVDAETGFSGGEVQVFLLMEGLRQAGERCVLFAPPGSRALAEAEQRGFEVGAVPLRNDVDVLAAVRLARGLRRVGADVCHLHTGRATWLGGWAARWSGVPAITTRRMDRKVRPGWRTRTTYERLTRAVAAISPGVVHCLEAGGVPSERIELIPSTVDPQRLVAQRERAVVRTELGAQSSEVVILSLGALVPRKGFDVLLDAFELIGSDVPWRLWIAGDGPERAGLQARARAFDTAGSSQRVRLLGRRSDVGDLLAAADAFVLPSRAEGLGVAALEAMAVGLPVLATRVGGLGDAVLDGQTGRLVEPGDAAGLASVLASWLRDPEERARLGRGGPERIAERFLPEHMVCSYRKLYDRILAEQPR